MKDWTDYFTFRIRDIYESILREASGISHTTALLLTRRWALSEKLRRSARQRVDFEASWRWFEEEYQKKQDEWQRLSASKRYSKKLRKLRATVLNRKNSKFHASRQLSSN